MSLKFSPTKRRFLTGGAAALTVLPTWRRAVAARGYDLIVVGAGTAGMPAAIFAAKRGAKVLVIERTNVLGGTLDRAQGQLSAAGTRLQKSKGIEDSAEAHFADCLRINAETADPALTRLATTHAAETIDWLTDIGYVISDNYPTLGGHEPYMTKRCYNGPDGARGILKAMQGPFEAAVKAGKIDLRLDTGAIDLIQDRSGAVVGVTIKADGGKAEDLMGANVLLAAGGCAANPRMFEEIHGVPLYAQAARPSSQGAGLMLGQGAGATLRYADRYVPLFGALMADDSLPGDMSGGLENYPERRLPWELWVNAHGRRFIREDHQSPNAREQSLGRQPGHRLGMVLNRDILERASPAIRGWTKEKYVAAFGSNAMFAEGGTLEELAINAGVNPRGLIETVTDYNTALKDGAIDPLGRQHRPAAIDKGPYLAARFQGWTLFSFAGLAADASLRVLRADGTPIPNLFAAGEILGATATSGQAYTNGMLLTPSMTFGRLVGQRFAKLQA